MTEWRLLRGWTGDELRARMDRLARARLNFEGVEAELTGEQGWHHYHSEAVIARETGAPGEQYFERARAALSNYRFSDPAIVTAYFDPKGALVGRRLLLEIKVFGLHYLCPTLITRVREEPGVYGFRYDTLEGHIERGMEWFLLTRDANGAIRFRIESRWQPGKMPNWWSRAGFSVLVGYFQRKWHRRAHNLLSMLAHEGSTQPGVDVTFTYHTKRKWLT